MLNLDAIKKVHVNNSPFPYFSLANSIMAEQADEIMAEFPVISAGGSFNKEDLAISPKFEQFLNSLDSKDFRHVLSDKFNTDVSDLPMMITYRGISRKKDGRIHTDSKTKVLTILIYFNPEWTADTGKLRILNSGDDMNDYVEEGSPDLGTMIAFKVTDNCWHGYPSYDGRRQSIQINFLTSSSANRKHRFFHSLSAKLKTLFR